MMTDTIGASNHGINNDAFITIGKPKITGSLTLKIPGAMAKRATSLYCFLVIITIIKIKTIKVDPDPPNDTVKVSINDFVTM